MLEPLIGARVMVCIHLKSGAGGFCKGEVYLESINRCPECGAVWRDGLTCRDHFDQMLAWEFEDPEGAGALHHLTVLSYNLQHPSVYSPEGLEMAKQLMGQFISDEVSPKQVRRQNRQTLDSGKRSFKIAGTPEAQGVYTAPVRWTTTAGDVTAGGVDGLCARVQAWAHTVYAALKRSGNLPT